MGVQIFLPLQNGKSEKIRSRGGVHVLIGETVMLGWLEGNGVPPIGKLLLSVSNSVSLALR